MGWLTYLYCFKNVQTRNEIVRKDKTGAGTGTNIVNAWRRESDPSEVNLIRELAIFSKREGINQSDVASVIRLNNFIKKSRAPIWISLNPLLQISLILENHTANQIKSNR